MSGLARVGFTGEKRLEPRHHRGVVRFFEVAVVEQVAEPPQSRVEVGEVQEQQTLERYLPVRNAFGVAGQVHVRRDDALSHEFGRKQRHVARQSSLQLTTAKLGLELRVGAGYGVRTRSGEVARNDQPKHLLNERRRVKFTRTYRRLWSLLGAANLIDG